MRASAPRSRSTPTASSPPSAPPSSTPRARCAGRPRVLLGRTPLRPALRQASVVSRAAHPTAGDRGGAARRRRHRRAAPRRCASSVGRRVGRRRRARRVGVAFARPSRDGRAPRDGAPGVDSGGLPAPSQAWEPPAATPAPSARAPARRRRGARRWRLLHRREATRREPATDRGGGAPAPPARAPLRRAASAPRRPAPKADADDDDGRPRRGGGGGAVGGGGGGEAEAPPPRGRRHLTAQSEGRGMGDAGGGVVRARQLPPRRPRGRGAAVPREGDDDAARQAGGPSLQGRHGGDALRGGVGRGHPTPSKPPSSASSPAPTRRHARRHARRRPRRRRRRRRLPVRVPRARRDACPRLVQPEGEGCRAGATLAPSAVGSLSTPAHSARVAKVLPGAADKNADVKRVGGGATPSIPRVAPSSSNRRRCCRRSRRRR